MPGVALCLYLAQAAGLSVSAQVLDRDFLPTNPVRPVNQALSHPLLRRPAKNSLEFAVTRQAEPSNGKKSSDDSQAAPLSVTVSKTLYLPPEMYGQWSVSGTLLETNAREYFSPTVEDIWILDRSGDQVVLSNPATGASAAVSVDRVEGERATFHREGVLSRTRAFQETPTITVMGDILNGQSVNKIKILKNGALVREYYAIYRLEAQRIAGARVRFQPGADYSPGPDIHIDEVRSTR